MASSEYRCPCSLMKEDDSKVLGRWHRVRNNLAFLHSPPGRSLCTTIRSSNCWYFLLLVDWRSSDRGHNPAFGFRMVDSAVQTPNWLQGERQGFNTEAETPPATNCS